jgi:hypothetical protein
VPDLLLADLRLQETAEAGAVADLHLPARQHYLLGRGLALLQTILLLSAQQAVVLALVLAWFLTWTFWAIQQMAEPVALAL